MADVALESYLQRDMLRLLTCGSVDDGKSTLIGRLLHDSRNVYQDQLAAIGGSGAGAASADERGGEPDLALLLDGLRAEREQGITIDVAYRYFATPRRKFIIADCPGHVQYTRNMVTGGSTASLALLLVDAEKGLLEQTRRHALIVSLLDIGHVVVAVNKMDAVDYSQELYERICDDYQSFSARLASRHVHFVPVSALRGDNVVQRSKKMSWHRGPPLLEYLETVYVASERNLIDLRFPVQLVLRPDASFRGYAGTVASGILRPGAEVVVLPSNQRTRVAQVYRHDQPVEEAFPPMAVTVTVDNEIDISRGDVLVHPRNMPRTSAAIEATLVWLDQAPLVLGRSYLLKQGTTETRAEVETLHYRFDVNTLHRVDAQRLRINEIGRAQLSLQRRLPFDAYTRNRATGSFVLVDPLSNATVAAGMVLDRYHYEEHAGAAADQTLASQSSMVTPVERANRLGHLPATLWLTGLPRSGKSTLAYALERHLFEHGYATTVIDGDNLRLGISSDLTFSATDRRENIRRAAHMATLLNDAGLIAIVALVSPIAAARAEAREIIGSQRFVEAFVDTPLELCEARDDRGLYARARRGEIEKFTGISAPFEAPDAPDVHLGGGGDHSVEDDVGRLLAALVARGVVQPS